MKYKNIIFDFDGVIIESNEIKEGCFGEVLSHFSCAQVDSFLKYHRENLGISRYVKFEYLYREILGRDPEKSEIDSLLERFSRLTLERLGSKEIIIDCMLNFIRKCHTNINLHIASGTDQDDLQRICHSLDLEKYFLSIGGSPTKKSDLVKNIVESFSYHVNETALIGDSFQDYKAASDVGVDFLGFNNEQLRDLSIQYLEKDNIAIH